MRSLVRDLIPIECKKNIMDSYKPDLEPEDLFEVISQVLLSSVDRDAYSGWGAEVYLITPETITIRRLKNRMD